jgi:hypothetical protein
MKTNIDSHRRPGFIVGAVLLLLCLVNPTIAIRAQVVTASRALLPFTADEITAVTDWGDSVYAVTGSGTVVAFDTLFTSSRVVTEFAGIRAGRLWVYDGDLFIEDPGVGVYVCRPTGERQFLMLADGRLRIGFTYSMQPMFVVDSGAFTIARSESGYWDVIRHPIHVPYFNDILQVAFTTSCVLVLRDAQRATIYRDNGSVDSALIVSSRGQTVHMIDDTTHVITTVGSRVEPIILGDNVCSNTSPYYGFRFGTDSLLTMNGATSRTTARAPLVVFHGDFRKGTSTMIVWRFKHDFDTSYNVLVPERQWTASTTDRAIYLYGPDGWIRRVSLTTRTVHMRSSNLCERCAVTQVVASRYSKDNSSSLLERSQLNRLRPLIIERDTIRDLSHEDVRFAGFRSSSDLRWYHRFPNGAEVYQYSGGFALRQRESQWQFQPLEAQGGSQSIDSNTVLLPPVMIRYRAEVDSIVVQNIAGRQFHWEPHGATKKYLVFANSALDIVRRDDWRDSVEFRSLPVRATFAGSFHDNDVCLLVRGIQNKSSFDYDTLYVFRVNLSDMSFDAVHVKLMEPLPQDFRAVVVRDTLRLFSQSRSLFASVDNDGNVSYQNLSRSPLVSRVLGIITSIEVHDVPRVIARSSSARREYVIHLDARDSAVTVEGTDDLTVALQHIFMMKVYPNPGTTGATLEMRRHGSSDGSPTELFLVDMLGNHIRDYTASTDFRFTVGSIGRATLDYTGIPSGQYVLVMRNSGVTTSKLVSISR